MQFNVTVGDPSLRLRYFDDMMTVVAAGLREHGHTTVNAGGFDPDRINVVFGFHDAPTRFRKTSVVYQLEPVCTYRIDIGQVPLAALRSHVVWDYSRHNIEQLRRHGIEAHYAPIGHHPCLERIEPAAEQDIDVLFYGYPSQRRLAILAALRRAELRVANVDGTFGAALDPIIARAKVVLNLHARKEYRPLESVRIGYLMSNRKAIVAEVNHSDDDDGLAAGLIAVPYHELVDTCIDLVRADDARADAAAAGHAVISGRPIADILDKVLHTVEPLDPLAGAWGPRY